MPSGLNKIDDKLDYLLLITLAIIDDNSQASDEKMKRYYSKLDKQYSKLENITEMIKKMMDQNQNLN